MAISELLAILDAFKTQHREAYEYLFREGYEKAKRDVHDKIKALLLENHALMEEQLYEAIAALKPDKKEGK